MPQIRTDILSKLSAPHLKQLKKQELLDLYSQLHKEYGQHVAPQVEEEEESGKVMGQKTAMMTVREMPIMMREMQMPAPKQQNMRKRIVRDEHGRILEVIEEPV